MAKVFEPTIIYGSVLKNKSFTFSVRVVKLYKILLQRDKDYDPIFKQLLRCGTSIGANVSEAHSAASRKDFINKLLISLKEARETEFWLTLLNESKIINSKEYKSLNNDCDELERILTSSIKTAKSNV
ncbi:MAG: four helix bundle protein [Ignavibacteriales bacterium]|nr:four helix bundle protein [Ignavibacteriales bacterium]